MFEGYNGAINAIFAIILALSPRFFDSFGITPEEARAVYAAAQQRADHIVRTGDTSDIEQLEGAVAQLGAMASTMEPFMPLMEKVAGGMRLPSLGEVDKAPAAR